MMFMLLYRPTERSLQQSNENSTGGPVLSTHLDRRQWEVCS